MQDLRNIRYVPGESIADLWLHRYVDTALKSAVREHFRIGGIEYREMQTPLFRPICWRADQVDFLRRYEADRRSLAWEETPYYAMLLRSTAKPGKAEKIQSKYPELSAEDASLAWVHKRLTSFIKLYDDIKHNGWDFKKGPGNIDGRRRESYVSTIEVPSDVDSLNVVFHETEVRRILASEMLPQKVIDGHHRLVCLQVLDVERVPTAVHLLERK